jgi:hypothetical protein
MIADPQYPRLRIKTTSYSGVVQTFMIYVDPPVLVLSSATASQVRSGGSAVRGAFFAYRMALRKLTELSAEWTVTVMGDETLITLVHAMHLTAVRQTSVAETVVNDDRFSSIRNMASILQLTLDSIGDLSAATN